MWDSLILYVLLRCLIADFLINQIIWPLFVPLAMSLTKSKHTEPL
jgi:hypothetical protein